MNKKIDRRLSGILKRLAVSKKKAGFRNIFHEINDLTSCFRLLAETAGPQKCFRVDQAEEG